MVQALANAAFRHIWLAAALWYICLTMEGTVLAWLVLEMTDSPFMVTLVGFFRLLPMSLLGLAGGSIADRLPKKPLLVGVQSVGILSGGAMVVLLSTGLIQPWHVFILVFITGIADTTDFSARRALIAEVIEPPRFLNAVSLHVAALTGSGIVGPVLGGLLIAMAGFSGAYIAIVAIYVVALALMVTVRYSSTSRVTKATGSILSQIQGALTTVRTNRTVWVVLLVTIAFNFFVSPVFFLIPVIARDGLGVGEVLYGILASATGFGALVGSLVIASRGTKRPATLFSVGAFIVLVTVGIFALSSFYPLSLTLLVIAGLGMSGFATMQSAIVLQAVEPEMRGRAMGAIALGIGTSPAGILLAGWLAERFGAQTGLAMLASGGMVALTALLWRYPELRDRPSRPTAVAQAM